MKKWVKFFLVLVFLAPMLSFGDQMQDKSMSSQNPAVGVVDAWQKSMGGQWKGVGQVMDMQTFKLKPYQSTLVIQPILQDRFMLLEEKAQEGSSGQIFQGKSISNYNPTTQKYVMFRFDSMGWGGQFEGQRAGNILTYTHANQDGSTMTLLCESINSDTERLTMKLQKSGEEPKVVGEVTYTRTSHTLPESQKTDTMPTAPSY